VNAILAELAPPVATTLVGGPGTVAIGVTAVDGEEATELPFELVATTVKVYAVPFVNPVTLRGELAPVTEILPGLEVTVYPVITLPPVVPGAENETLADDTPAVAITPVGEPGTVAGVTDAEATEATELPTAFVATTVKV
jgi:hypothetical protein